jgi:hypothetical protein
LTELETKPDASVKTEPKKVPRVMLTARQKAILDKLTAPMDVKSAAGDLGISRAAIYNSNKRVFHNFEGLLDAMIKYYPVFDRRFQANPEDYSKLRRLARLVRSEIGG